MYFTDNYRSWEIFMQKQVVCHKMLDQVDQDYSTIKKIFDLRAGAQDYAIRKAKLADSTKNIVQLFETISNCHDCIQKMITQERKEEIANQLKKLKNRMDILDKTEKKLGLIEDFNQRLSILNDVITEIESYLVDVRKKFEDIMKPSAEIDLDFSPEDRQGKLLINYLSVLILRISQAHQDNGRSRRLGKKIRIVENAGGGTRGNLSSWR
jgi:DNA repair exonuclease SbcCD ATPase subunit